MEVAIMEIGDFHCASDITQVFLTEEKAIENVPVKFDHVRTTMCSEHYYESKLNNRKCKPQRWLTIKTYEVEGEVEG